MRTDIRWWINMGSKGAVMPIVAVGTILFLGMAAISIDAGIAY